MRVRYADYYGGSGERSLTFMYRVKPGDRIGSVDVATAHGDGVGVASWLHCNGTMVPTAPTDPCALVNKLGQVANLTVAASIHAASAAGASPRLRRTSPS